MTERNCLRIRCVSYFLFGLIFLFSPANTVWAKSSQNQPVWYETQPKATAMAFNRKRSDYKGKMQKLDFTFNECKIEKFNISYSLFILLGEGAANGAFSWEAEEGEAVDCLSPYTFFALTLVGAGKRRAYVTLKPLVPKSGESGFNVAGSPNWKEMFWDVNSEGKMEYFDARRAKNFWRAGFKVVDFVIYDNKTEKELQKKAVSP